MQMFIMTGENSKKNVYKRTNPPIILIPPLVVKSTRANNGRTEERGG